MFLLIADDFASSDFAIIPKRSLSPTMISESRTQGSDSFKTAKSKYITASMITQVNYLTQKISNPFEKLLTANESFTYHKPYSNHLSQNTILEEDETEDEYEELEGMSVSAGNVRSSPNHQAQYNCTVQPNANSALISDLLAGKFEQEVSIPNNLLVSNHTHRSDGATMTNLEGQGDSNERNENVSIHHDRTSISVKINFAFYAKLLAFLLTINTIMFLKTFVFTNVFNLWMK